MRRGFTLVEFVIVLAVVGIIAAIIFSAVNQYQHGGCAEYQNTGGMTCHNSGSYTHCDPERVCVRYGDGTPTVTWWAQVSERLGSMERISIMQEPSVGQVSTDGFVVDVVYAPRFPPCPKCGQRLSHPSSIRHMQVKGSC